MPKSISFQKEDLRKKLKEYGLSEARIQEISNLFDKKNNHLDVVSFVILLERFGITRSNIVTYLKDINIDDGTIINIFTKADYKKEDLGSRDVTQVILDE